MSDLLDKAREAMGSLERRVAELPVIRDYKEKEMRRELDRRVRQRLMETLEQTRAALNDLQQEVLAAGGLQWMDDMERINSRLTLLVDRVRSAAYGYRPLFDLEKVREVELDRLLHFDRNILARTPELEQHLAAAREAATQSAESFAQALKELYAAVTELADLYTRREQVIRGEEVEAPPLPEETRPATTEGPAPTVTAEPSAGSDAPAAAPESTPPASAEPATTQKEDT